MIKLIPFEQLCSRINLEKIAHWRNQVPETLRSTNRTHPELQIFWYDKVVADKTCRYFYIHNIEDDIIGYCGLDKISTINKTAEISLLINPELHKTGHGRDAISELLLYGFEKLKLNCIFAEVYLTTNNWEFWRKMGFKEEGLLRERKFWKGRFYHSVSGSILKSEWTK